jgi:hypothetical protein
LAEKVLRARESVVILEIKLEHVGIRVLSLVCGKKLAEFMLAAVGVGTVEKNDHV